VHKTNHPELQVRFTPILFILFFGLIGCKDQVQTAKAMADSQSDGHDPTHHGKGNVAFQWGPYNGLGGTANDTDRLSQGPTLPQDHLGLIFTAIWMPGHVSMKRRNRTVPEKCGAFH